MSVEKKSCAVNDGTAFKVLEKSFQTTLLIESH